jgi:hypothetical protein
VRSELIEFLQARLRLTESEFGISALPDANFAKRRLTCPKSLTTPAEGNGTVRELHHDTPANTIRPRPKQE